MATRRLCSPKHNCWAVWATGRAALYCSEWSWHGWAAQAVARYSWPESQSPCSESCTGSVRQHWSLYSTVGGRPCLGSYFIFLTSPRKAQLDASCICSVSFSICFQNLFYSVPDFLQIETLPNSPSASPRPSWAYVPHAQMSLCFSLRAGLFMAIRTLHRAATSTAKRKYCLCFHVQQRNVMKRRWLRIERPGGWGAA